MEAEINIHIVRTLQRIRQVISDSVRSYESLKYIDCRLLNEAKVNLRRISSNISLNTFNELTNALNALNLLQDEEQQQQQQRGFTAPRTNISHRGRPAVILNNDQVQLLYNEGFTAGSMSKHLGCSISTIYKKLYELNMPMKARYSTITDNELRTEILQIHREHPNAGQTMMQSYLKAKNITVTRKRIRNTLREIDPVGTASRWSQSIKRRVYSVSSSNSLWHMDAHLKLSRWGFVIHGCIDGYSRLIVYLKCETSIQAEPVVKLFIEAANTYGLPSRVRSDHGYENILVAVLMNTIRGLNRGSHITGKSVHNQRIERLWLDVFKEVCESVYRELYLMEDEGLLIVDNVIHRFCVQYVYIIAINRKLISFQSGWNHHCLRTENNKTPRQLWIEGVLSNYNTEFTAIHEIIDTNVSLLDRLSDSLATLGADLTEPVLDSQGVNTSSFTASLELSEAQKELLNNTVNTEGISDKDKYKLCVNLLSSD